MSLEFARKKFMWYVAEKHTDKDEMLRLVEFLMRGNALHTGHKINQFFGYTRDQLIEPVDEKIS